MSSESSLCLLGQPNKVQNSRKTFYKPFSQPDAPDWNPGSIKKISKLQPLCCLTHVPMTSDSLSNLRLGMARDEAVIKTTMVMVANFILLSVFLFEGLRLVVGVFLRVGLMPEQGTCHPFKGRQRPQLSQITLLDWQHSICCTRLSAEMSDLPSFQREQRI